MESQDRENRKVAGQGGKDSIGQDGLQGDWET